MNRLTCHRMNRLDGISPEELKRLFPEPSSVGLMIPFLQESGIEGFDLWSIAVYEGNTPILLLPLFSTRFDMSNFVGGWVNKLLKAAGCLAPSLFKPRILAIGLVVGEWSEIGIDPKADAGVLASAFKMAFSELHALSVKLKSDIVAVYNFAHYDWFPGEALKRFNRVECQSCAQMPIPFKSMDEFFASLSKAARKDLRRKMRVASEVRVIRTRDISQYLDKIYSLYLDTARRSALTFGENNRAFFEKICERIPGAEYALYFVQDELLAFNLLVVNQEMMIDKNFCMNIESGRKYYLYFLSWLDNVRECIERGVPLYHAGLGVEKTKAHLGANLLPMYLLFKHRLPAMNRLLLAKPAATEKILGRLGFWVAPPPRPESAAMQSSGEPESPSALAGP